MLDVVPQLVKPLVLRLVLLQLGADLRLPLTDNLFCRGQSRHDAQRSTPGGASTDLAAATHAQTDLQHGEESKVESVGDHTR